MSAMNCDEVAAIEAQTDVSQHNRRNKWLGLLNEWKPSLAVPPRVFLVFILLSIPIASHLLMALGPESWSTFFTVLSVLLWIVWFIVLFMMTIPAADNWLRPHLKRLKYASVVLGVLLALLGIIEIVGLNLLATGSIKTELPGLETADAYTDEFTYNDGTAMVHLAAENLLEGENPYVEADIIEALDRSGIPPTSITPLKQGAFSETWPYPTAEEIDRVMQEAEADSSRTSLEFEDKLTYPAGSFLFPSAFLATGLDDLRWFYAFCIVLLFGVVLRYAPRKLWMLVLLVAVASLELWNDIFSGGTGGLYLLFLALGWVLLDRNIWLSATFMGLAATSKQLAWIFVLFYLILVLRTIGWKRCFQMSAVIGGIFVATNIPFIIDSPTLWLESVFAPVLDPMFPRGVGVVAFAIEGITPPGSNIGYAVAEAAVLGVGLLWFYFKCFKYPDAGLVLAVLPLFFAWRSYSNYIYPAAILVFAVILIRYLTSAAQARHEAAEIPLSAREGAYDCQSEFGSEGEEKDLGFCP